MSKVTDDELRAELSAYLNHQVRLGGSGVGDDKFRDWCNGVLAGDSKFRLATGQDADVRFARIIARRLLELLPPADDGEAVTADWLKSVGFEKVSTFETLSIDCNDGNMVHHSPTLGWWWISAKHGDKVSGGQQPTRGHVRRLCAALGVTMTEPRP